MIKRKMTRLAEGTTVICALVSLQAQAAIALDRTRVVVEGNQQSVSLSVSNENTQLPYLAQGWIEDTRGEKMQSPLAVLPPVQRIEPGSKSQIKIQVLQAASLLAQDRETLYYFNLREIPPRTDKPNTLQLALQTRIKLFYRPKALVPERGTAPWQEKLLLTRVGGRYQVNNPTPYYITLVEGAASVSGKAASGFEPMMLAPYGQATLKPGVDVLGTSPVLTYINDFGGRPQLKFTCSSNRCMALPVKPKA